MAEPKGTGAAADENQRKRRERSAEEIVSRYQARIVKAQKAGKLYRGLNILLLSLGQPYRSPWWLTFRQAGDLGGYIRKDEHSSIVTFWKFPKKQTNVDERPVKSKGEFESDHHAPLLRYYNVFNLEQNRD